VTPTLKTKKKGDGFFGGLSIVALGKRVIKEVQDDNCLGFAAQLSFYFLLALFPFLLFLTALLAYVPIPNLMEKIFSLMATMVPSEAMTLVQDNVKTLVTQQRGGLLSLGIVMALWTSSSAITAITDTLNRAYDVKEGPPFWKVRGIAILLTVGLSVLIVTAMALLLLGPAIGSWVAGQFGLGQVFEVAWLVLRWVVIVAFLVLAMGLIYYMAPDVEQKWKWLTPGSIFAVLATLGASVAFSYYVENFGSYNETYGSIGAVIVLLLWMYLVGFFILVGGEINAEIEHAAAGGKEPGEKQID
jgi:membrane protein